MARITFVQLSNILLFCFLLQIAQHSAQQLCRHGEELCDRSCFNPLKYQCFRSNVSSSYDKLCRHNESLCTKGSYSSVCYDPEYEVCHTSSNDVAVCKPDERICTSWSSITCFNPATHQCLKNEASSSSDWIICLKNQKLCGSTCYFPESNICIQ